jgi:60 kDa SS-A/Ro ribonucleoprotein
MANKNLASASAALQQKAPSEGQFKLDDWTRLERFIILGTDGGRATEGAALTLASSKVLERCIHVDGNRTVETAVHISELGRAPKNEVALFVVAAAAATGDDKTRSLAYANLSKVARTGTHLFQFAEMFKALKGGSKDNKPKFTAGRGIRNAFADWYLDKDIQKVAYQILKYQNRNGWSHADILRIAHAGSRNAHKDPRLTKEMSNIFKFIVDGELHGNSKAPEIIQGYLEAKTETDPKKLVALIEKYGLTREMIPTEALKNVAVWEALLQKMPMTAMVRNLGKMTSIKLIEKGSEAEKLVVKRLNDEEYLKKSKIHPIQVLMAFKTYEKGQGIKGKLTWDPTAAVKKALDEAFYKAFINAPKTDKRYYIGIDCSGSMGSPFVTGGALKSIEAATAMALVTLHAEEKVHIAGYASGGTSHYAHRGSGMKELGISRRMHVTTACEKALALNWGSTDCGMPYKDALARGEDYDVFINITDNDTNSGGSPHQTLREYRQKTGVAAKQIVIATYNSPFTIADPDDAGSLDLAGFDAASPAIVADFATDGKVRAKEEVESTVEEGEE